MGSKKAIKRMVSLMCAVILCMSYTMSAYAITYNVSVPTVKSSNTSEKMYFNVTGSMTASSATWIIVKHYLTYIQRGARLLQTEKISHGSGSVRVMRVEGTSTFSDIIGSGNSYYRAYNEGWYGRTSNGYVLYGSASLGLN